jgi:hypothetical protein
MLRSILCTCGLKPALLCNQAPTCGVRWHFRPLAGAIACAACVLTPGVHAQSVLHSNGTFVTNPTGGTGSIAGLPISRADGFNVPGSTFLFSTTGVNATNAIGTWLAEDFTVPEGESWTISQLTFYAFQTSQTTPTVTSIRVNFWDATPYSATSPGPVPDPLPMPLMDQPFELVPAAGSLVAHRQSPSSTGTVRPVFPYTVTLPDDGVTLASGTYWVQFNFSGAASPSQNVFTPLISPRTQLSVHNCRLLNSIDGSAGGPRIWFEGREGFVEGQAEGRAYSVPFEVRGVSNSAGCPADVNADGGVDGADVEVFFTLWSSGDGAGDYNADGGIDGADVEAFFIDWAQGC